MRFLASSMLFLLCVACSPDGIDNANFSGESGEGSSSSLTEERLLSYLELYKELKNEVPDVLEILNENELDVRQEDEFNAFERIIKDSGIPYSDFVSTNASVGTIFGLAEFDMRFYEELSAQNIGEMDNMIASIQEMIDDPDIPADKKIELQQSLQDAKNGKANLKNMWSQNQSKAADKIKRVKKKLNSVASQADIKLVEKYKKEIKEAYSGISRPAAMQETRLFN